MLLLHVSTLLLVGAGTDKYWRLLQTHLTEGIIQADLFFFSLKLVPDVSECLWVFHRGPPVFLLCLLALKLRTVYYHYDYSGLSALNI